MEAYIDYEYYTQEYLGREFTEEVFDRYAVKASRWLDKIICCDFDGSEEQVKMAACAVCDALRRFEERQGVLREENDGYSVSYDTAAGNIGKEVIGAAKIYLDDIMLYRGLYL